MRVLSRGRLEDRGTNRTLNTTTQVLNIIQKVPETVIHLKFDKEPKSSSGGPQGRRNEGSVGRVGTYI